MMHNYKDLYSVFLKMTTFLLFVLIACNKPSKNIKYSFFVAGHTYGNPYGKIKNKGLYIPFKNKIDYINKQSDIKHGFLLGDVVWTPKGWEDALKDIKTFQIPVDIVRGNHDGNLEAFKKKFGNSFKNFFIENDLFIILDLNLDQWNITGEQLDFFKNTLLNEGKKANNIFILSHQIFWYSKELFKKKYPNSLQGKAKKLNYWSEIEPFLQSINKPIFLFAGDVGAFPKDKVRGNGYRTIEYSYDKDKNITYITTGMGGGKKDNFIIVDVYDDNSVNVKLIPLNEGEIQVLDGPKHKIFNKIKKEKKKISVEEIKILKDNWKTKNISINKTDLKYNEKGVYNVLRNTNAKSAYLYTNTYQVKPGDRCKLQVVVKKGKYSNLLGIRLTKKYPSRIDVVFDLDKGKTIGVKKSSDFSVEKIDIEKLDDNWYKCLIDVKVDTEFIKIVFGPTNRKKVQSWEAAVNQKSDVYIVPDSFILKRISFQ